MKKFLRKIIFYGFLAGLIFNAFAWGCLYLLRNSSFYKPEYVAHEVKETEFDYIVVGSSIGLASLNTVQIDSTINTNGLNLSVDDTSLCSGYLMLQHFYHLNKKAKYCILAINYWDVSYATPSMKINDYRFLPFINEDYVFGYYNQMETGYFKPLTWSRYMPLIGVGYYNTEIIYPALLTVFKPEKKIDSKKKEIIPFRRPLILSQRKRLQYSYNGKTLFYKR